MLNAALITCLDSREFGASEPKISFEFTLLPSCNFFKPSHTVKDCLFFWFFTRLGCCRLLNFSDFGRCRIIGICWLRRQEYRIILSLCERLFYLERERDRECSRTLCPQTNGDESPPQILFWYSWLKRASRRFSNWAVNIPGQGLRGVFCVEVGSGVMGLPRATSTVLTVLFCSGDTGVLTVEPCISCVRRAIGLGFRPPLLLSAKVLLSA